MSKVLAKLEGKLNVKKECRNVPTTAVARAISYIFFAAASWSCFH